MKRAKTENEIDGVWGYIRAPSLGMGGEVFEDVKVLCCVKIWLCNIDMYSYIKSCDEIPTVNDICEEPFEVGALRSCASQTVTHIPSRNYH